MSDIALPSFRPEPRCHVCRDDDIREHVNAMLANGSSFAQIARSITVDDGGEFSLDSIRNHASRHFPVQSAAQATYREIVERRAAQSQIDFEAGLATALTPLAFLETIMVKAFDRVVQADTEVSVETGLRAAEKLQAVIGSGDSGAQILEMQVQVGRIIDAIKATVPQPMLAEVLAKLKEPGPGCIDVSDCVTAESEDPFDQRDDDEPFDPGDDGEDDDF